MLAQLCGLLVRSFLKLLENVDNSSNGKTSRSNCGADSIRTVESPDKQTDFLKRCRKENPGLGEAQSGRCRATIPEVAPHGPAQASSGFSTVSTTICCHELTTSAPLAAPSSDTSHRSGVHAAGSPAHPRLGAGAVHIRAES